jgi:hypothetical protein
MKNIHVGLYNNIWFESDPVCIYYSGAGSRMATMAPQKKKS